MLGYFPPGLRTPHGFELRTLADTLSARGAVQHDLEMAEARRASDLPGGTVTFLLTNVEGPTRMTRLWETNAPGIECALVRHDQIVSTAVAAHHGNLLKHKGKE